MAPAEQKKSLRARLREQLRQIAPNDLHQRSQAAAARLCQADAFEQARAIMLFLPLDYEIDARPIAVRAWQSNKMVTVPLVSYEQRHMIPVEIRSLTEPMEADHYGLRTPAAGQPIPPSMLDLVITPALALDQHGNRLGRGGGFYDRFFRASGFAGVSCGLALDEQVVQTIPTTDHDVPVDMIVTDERVIILREGLAGA
jgi:5-formyltetrahydrofolate cyclo-ligase